MQNEKIKTLMDSYIKLFGNEGVYSSDIKDIEELLEIRLPKDFKAIAKVYSGGLLGGYSLFDFSPPNNSNYDIVTKTAFYRVSELSLPHNYVALLEDDVRFIVMEIVEGNPYSSRVIECSVSDAYSLSKGESLIEAPRYYDSFSDFFEFLLKEEKKERAGEL